MLAGIAAATFFATLAGGFFAIRFRDHLHLMLGFSAGAVIGVAFFELLPEAISVAAAHYDVSLITTVVALAFLVYLIVDRTVVLHAHTDEGGHGARGTLGAGTLSFHSLLDGLGIGFAFQVSPVLGAIVTAAVLTHDFSDGINTVNLVLRTGATKRRAFAWLIIDALAPTLGILATAFISLPEHVLGILLAAFCGFFLYLGASDLLPESHHRHPTIWTSAATALGMAVIYMALQFAGH